MVKRRDSNKLNIIPLLLSGIAIIVTLILGIMNYSLNSKVNDLQNKELDLQLNISHLQDRIFYLEKEKRESDRAKNLLDKYQFRLDKQEELYLEFEESFMDNETIENNRKIVANMLKNYEENNSEIIDQATNFDWGPLVTGMVAEETSLEGYTENSASFIFLLFVFIAMILIFIVIKMAKK